MSKWWIKRFACISVDGKELLSSSSNKNYKIELDADTIYFQLPNIIFNIETKKLAISIDGQIRVELGLGENIYNQTSLRVFILDSLYKIPNSKWVGYVRGDIVHLSVEELASEIERYYMIKILREIERNIEARH